MRRRLGATPHRVVLLAGFLVATFLRLWMNLDLHPPGKFVFSDMGVYHWHALRIASHGLGPWATFSPHGYPLILAALYAISRRPMEVVAVFQALLGGSLCVLSAMVAERVTRSQSVAIAALLIVSFYPPLVYYGSLVLTELTAAFLLTLAAYGLLRATSPRAIILASAALAAAAIVRPNLLLLYPFLLIFLWSANRADRRTMLKNYVLFISISVALFVPICLINSFLVRRPAGLATNGGLNFYLARAPYKSVTYQGYRITPVPNLMHHEAILYSPVPLYDEPHFYREGLAQIVADPWSLIRSFDNVREGLGLGR